MMQSDLIPLSGKRGEGKFAKVDSDLHAIIRQHSWHLNSGGYASNSTLGLMHRFVVDLTSDDLKTDPDLLVDHLNGDRLDNRRANLRPKTSKGNAKNRTNDPVFDGLTGVSKLESGDYSTTHRGLNCYTSSDPRMCALCYDSIVTYCYGSGKRINDLKSKEPLDISFWKLDADVMKRLNHFKAKHTNFIGVKKTKMGWRAVITVDLGEFPTEVEAAQAYDKAYKILNKEVKSSQLNFN